MQNVTDTAEEIVDIWPYVDAIPQEDLEGFTLRDVAYVYLNPDGNYLHVLIATEDKNVVLVVVIETSTPKIYGHHLLDLVKLYGLDEEAE
ncbi:hypothetical protein [Hymenobacter ruber]